MVKNWKDSQKLLAYLWADWSWYNLFMNVSLVAHPSSVKINKPIFPCTSELWIGHWSFWNHWQSVCTSLFNIRFFLIIFSYWIIPPYIMYVFRVEMLIFKRMVRQYSGELHGLVMLVYWRGWEFKMDILYRLIFDVQVKSLTINLQAALSRYRRRGNKKSFLMPFLLVLVDGQSVFLFAKY